mgnify:FL=1
MAGMTPAGYAALAAGEAWHYVGEAGEPAFENSWANASTGLPKLAFRIREVGVVDIQGTVDGGASGASVFTLPEGYRPSALCYLPMSTLDGNARYMIVNTTGSVEPYFDTAGTSAYLYAQVFLDPPAVA